MGSKNNRMRALLNHQPDVERLDIERDDLLKIAAVARRLYSEQRMSGDTMRNAAQLLEAAIRNAAPDLAVSEPHATYDARLK
jgi:hypothetical protein